ncbi:MAG TPA: zinc ribbon domain-containing protein [Nitrolancea sp.]|nr:zinc ribbon domain-containing protein [Nitrolancea sp.]
MEAAIARGIQLLVALGGAYLLALWFALIVWTFQDIQLRSRSVVAQIFSTLVVVLFFVPGVLIYMILRPRDTLDESFQRSLEEEYLLQDLDELLLCPTCQHQVEADFSFCPHCRGALRAPCTSCERLIDLRWDICPYCGEEQYPEDVPLQVPAGDEWRPVEHEGVGRFLGQARDRLGGHRPKAIPQETPGQPTVSSDTWAIPRDHRGNDWDRSRDVGDTYPPIAPDQAGPSDAFGTPSAGSWDAQTDDTSSSRNESTDELPTGPMRR